MHLVIRLLLNPIFLDCQSNPNPSQIYDWQSKSKSNFLKGLTIQSKSNHNPTIFGKRFRTEKTEWSSFMMKPWNSQEIFLIKFQPYCKIMCLKILMKISLASLLEHDALWNYNLLLKLFWCIGFGLKWQNWIDNPNPNLILDCQSQSNPPNWIAIRIEQSSNTLLVMQYFLWQDFPTQATSGKGQKIR